MTWFRVLVTFLVLLAFATKTFAEPCNAVGSDEVACSINVGDPAPYSGVLVTTETARSVQDLHFDHEAEVLELTHRKTLVEIDRDFYRDLSQRLKEQLDPDEFYENPWFWLFLAASGLGVYAAVN